MAVRPRRWSPPSSAVRRAACGRSRTAAPAGSPDVVRDRAAAAGRHAVPDALLPDLPPGGLRDRHAGGGGPDERDDGPAGRRRGPAPRPTTPRTRTTWPAGASAVGAGASRCPGPSAGGMPDRVKCLHVLVAHALAAPGVNPLGGKPPRRGPWWTDGPCVPATDGCGTARCAAQRRDEKRPMTRRVAAIDCGTNSIRLLVADLDPDRATLTDLDRRMEIVRLGPGRGPHRPARPGGAGPHADRAAASTRRSIAGTGADAVRLRGHQRHPGRGERGRVRPPGHARSSASTPRSSAATRRPGCPSPGATADWALAPRSAEPPYLVVDIGGGSTEFVLGSGGDGDAGARVDIGCVRMTERHLRADPPYRRADRRGHGRHRRRPRPRRAAVSTPAAGAHPGRPGRLGHHGGRHRAGAARLRPGPAAPRSDQRGRGPRGDRPPAGPDPSRARRHPGDAPGPGRRHRRRGPHPGPR